MKRSPYIVALIVLTFFVISLFTNILGALNPSVSVSFSLSKAMAGFLPFAFFIAYGLMSIPSGFLVEKYKEKKMMVAGFLLGLIAAILFATFPTFKIFLVSLFLLGTGMTMLQVIINPLLRVSGGEENYAFYSVLSQLFFGAASFVGPRLYSWVIANVHVNAVKTGKITQWLERLTPSNLSWVAVYWIFAIIGLFMILLIAFSKFPIVTLKEDEKTGALNSYSSLFKNKYVILFFLAIFAYVGTEQGVSYWMSQFLSDYHGYDYETTGSDAVGYFWGLMTVGGILGLILLKIFDSKKVLRWFTIVAIICLSFALFGSNQISLFAFPLMGFFMSVMYPIIISLALNSVDKHHGSFAGILMTGIMGGAVVQLLIGGVADISSLRTGMFFNYITLGYVLSLSFWAKPIITNKTMKLGSRKKN
jgi:FHS family L-fucose permease-like MFS transporter